MDPEIIRRNAMATAYDLRMATKVYKEILVLGSVRLMLSNAVSFSRLKYNCQIWTKLTVKQSKRWTASHNNIIRNATCKVSGPDNHWTEVQVLAEAGKPDAMQHLRLERLRYAWRMYHNAPPQLKALVAEARGGKRTWSSELETDFIWLNKVGPADIRKLQGDIWEQTWQAIGKTSANAWKGIIKYAEKHAVLTTQRKWQLHRGTKRISDRMTAERMEPPHSTIAKAKQKSSTWFKCKHCEYATNGLHGIRSHVSRRHHIRHDATKFLGKTWPEDAHPITHCRACLTDCRTRYRAIVHLKRSNKCLEACRHWLPASSKGGYMLDTKEKWVRGVRQSMTTEKCMTKICGPKLPTIKEMG